MKLRPASKVRPLTAREILMKEYTEWNASGKRTAPTARLLAGMYATLYRKRYRLLPVSPVRDDLEAFDGLLGIVSENIRLAPYCLDVLFSLKDFNVNAQAFCNPRVIDRWNVIERATKLSKRNSSHAGEQAEYRSDVPGYCVIRV